LRTSATWFIIHIVMNFVKHFFRFLPGFFTARKFSGGKLIFTDFSPIHPLLRSGLRPYLLSPVLPKPAADQSRNHGCLRSAAGPWGSAPHPSR